MKYTECLNDECFFTGLAKEYCECHHVFFGPLRKKSDKWGMKVYLTPKYHRHSPSGVHVNRHNDLTVKKYAQKCFEEKHGHDKFMEIFGRNYL